MATAAKGDYYNLLGVKRGVSTADVRKAYKRLARKFHPDVNPGDASAEERFKQIQEAYDVLSDAKKRKMYDQHGFYSDHFQPAAGAGGAGYGGFDFGGFDFSEVTPRGNSFRDIFVFDRRIAAQADSTRLAALAELAASRDGSTGEPEDDPGLTGRLFNSLTRPEPGGELSRAV